MCHYAFTIFIRKRPKLQNMDINLACPVGQDLDVPLAWEDEVRQHKFLGRICIHFKTSELGAGWEEDWGMNEWFPYEIAPEKHRGSQRSCSSYGSIQQLFWSGGILKEEPKIDLSGKWGEFIRTFHEAGELKGCSHLTSVTQINCTQS